MVETERRWPALVRAGVWVLAGLALPVPLAAQSASWVQPYSDVPAYWELVGRLFGETAAINADARMKGITAPAVLAVASVPPLAKPGDTVASLAAITYNGGSDNLADIDQPRLVIKDLTEVRVSLAGARNLDVELRTGSSSFEHQQCIDLRAPRLLFLLDARWQAIAACRRIVYWSPWRNQTRLPLAGGAYIVDGVTTLIIAYDEGRKELGVSVETPGSRQR